MKRKIWIYMFLVLMIAGPLWAAQAKPIAKNAGRIVSLTPVFHITGETEDGGFFLKNPINLKIAPDQSFFVLDDEQFLRFDKNGKFLGNQQKKGAGPGEYEYISNYFFAKNSIFIYVSQPSKLLETDLTGKLLQECCIKDKILRGSVVGYVNGTFWILERNLDIEKSKSGEMIVDMDLAQHDLKDQIQKSDLVFPEKIRFIKQMHGEVMQIMLIIIVPAIHAHDGQNTLYISNSQQYGIKRVDLLNKKIAATLNREYVSVPYKKPEPVDPMTRMNPTPPKFFNDVQGIYIYNDALWVLTSTVTKGKGVLVDVFSKQGIYSDSFYLPLPGVETVHQLKDLQLAVYKDYLLVVELDDEENPQIVKYSFRL